MSAPSATSPSAAPPFLVTLGASAGGLEALQAFFRSCPEDLGIAFVVIQHLSPDHKSLMDELLGRCTYMPVTVVTDGEALNANHVHLIPAGNTIQLNGETFKVIRRSGHELVLPIDDFLNSAAPVFHNRQAAIILSGTGSDGSRGALLVNQRGGLVLAQAPDEAKFDGMPRSVLATGIVDRALPVSDMPNAIAAFIEHPSVFEPPFDPEAADQDDNAETDVLHSDDPEGPVLLELEKAFKTPFRDYKRSTVNRRITRRMQVTQQPTINNYLQLIRADRTEQESLRRDILISVTRFFRDQALWDMVEGDVLPSLVTSMPDNSELRIWIPGVSTGEEAYSYAMLIIEQLEHAPARLRPKIFATDLSVHNIEIAAQGHYPLSIAEEMSAQRLARFFERTEDGYKVKDQLRQSVVFARQDLLTDPSFTRMNLVSCRNVLIYFNAEAQKQVLEKLCFSLTIGGYLILGSSESLREIGSDFAEVSSKWKVYSRVNQSPRSNLPVTAMRRQEPVPGRGKSSQPAPDALNGSDSLDWAKEQLIEHYAPPTMLVDANGLVFQFYGAVHELIQVRQGAAELNIRKLLPDSLVPVVMALLHRVRREQKPLTSEPMRFAHLHREYVYSVSIAPTTKQVAQGLFLVSFLESRSQDSTPVATTSIDTEMNERVKALQMELQATRESLQSTIEELETSNEELQATNEELMASNEELQSANEELQSVNEELNTVNAEYQEKMALMQRTNAELESLSRANGIATVFIDAEMKITRYTPYASDLFRIRESDIGRPLEDLVSVFDFDWIKHYINETFATGLVREVEQVAKNGKRYLIRLVPYKTTILGDIALVISFVDITAVQNSQQLQEVINALPEQIAVLDEQGDIVMVNRAWQRFAQVNGDPDLQYTDVGQNYLAVCKGDGETSTGQQSYLGIKAVLEGSESRFSLVYPCHAPSEKRWFTMNVIAIQGEGAAAVVSHFNITEFYQGTRKVVEE